MNICKDTAPDGSLAETNKGKGSQETEVVRYAGNGSSSVCRIPVTTRRCDPRRDAQCGWRKFTRRMSAANT